MDNSKAIQVLTQAYGMPVDFSQALLEVKALALCSTPKPLDKFLARVVQDLEYSYSTDIQTLAQHAIMTWPSSTH